MFSSFYVKSTTSSSGCLDAKPSERINLLVEYLPIFGLPLNQNVNQQLGRLISKPLSTVAKASELVPGSLLPHWNSVWFFVTGSLSELNSLLEVRFMTLYLQSFQTRHKNCNFYVTMLWLDHVHADIVKFAKSWLWTLSCRQKIPYFFFPIHGGLALNIC